MRDVCEEVRASNAPQMNATADPLAVALDDLEAATNFLLNNLIDGHKQVVLSGATPYLLLIGLTSGNIYLAKSALMNFMATNLLSETASLRATIENGADTLLQAGSLLAAAANG